VWSLSATCGSTCWRSRSEILGQAASTWIATTPLSHVTLLPNKNSVCLSFPICSRTCICTGGSVHGKHSEQMSGMVMSSVPMEGELSPASCFMVRGRFYTRFNSRTGTPGDAGGGLPVVEKGKIGIRHRNGSHAFVESYLSSQTATRGWKF
jgi:hypothetical protein